MMVKFPHKLLMENPCSEVLSADGGSGMHQMRRQDYWLIILPSYWSTYLKKTSLLVSRNIVYTLFCLRYQQQLRRRLGETLDSFRATEIKSFYSFELL